jgi:hypothetical protein
MTSPSDLTLLRTQPHFENLFLSVYQPTVLFSAQVNGSISQGERIIPYDNPAGSYGNVFANSVLLVGTAAGLSDVGRVRIRSVDGSNFTVAENYDIPWASGQYLTAINYIDLNPIYPRIVSGTAVNGDPIIFYKDYDIAYSNQNSIMGAFPCAGSHQAAFISGSYAQVYWNASGTSHVNGDSLTYSWVFEGGSPGTYSGITPGYVHYSTPGHYKTTLTVTGSGGSSDTTYRFVSIYPRAANGNAIPPIQRWSASAINGSRSEGGYSVNFKVWDKIDNIYDGALVILFADQTSYGNTKTTIGSPIKFVGYIEKGTIVYDYQTSSVEFNATSVASYLKNIEAFSVSCNSSPSPAVWYEIMDMNVPKALYHYLKWHSTVLDCTDFQYLGDARAHQYFDTNRDSIYDAINTFLKNGVIGEVGSNRLGQMFAEISAGAVHQPASNIPINMSVTKQDWMGEPTLEETITQKYSALELGGVVFDGFFGGTGTSTAILCMAPGQAPGVRGKINSIEGFIALSQSQMNEVAGDLWAYQNARWAVTMKMAGNYNNLDIFPLSQCQLNIASTDTNRGITFTNAPFHPVQMDWVYDPWNGTIYPTVKFAQLTNGISGQTEAIAAAQTIPIPAVPTIPQINIPNPVLPTLPNIPPFNVPSIWGGKTYTWVISNPEVGLIPGPRLPSINTALRVDGAAEGTQVTFNILWGAILYGSGSNVMSSNLTVDSATESTQAFAHPNMLQNSWLWLNITNVSAPSGTSNQFVATLATTI